MGVLEAPNSTLGNLMEVALTFINNVTTKEASLDSSRDDVDGVLQYIRLEFGDANLYHDLKTMYDGFQGAQNNRTTV
jgi:hypothetical protein